MSEIIANKRGLNEFNITFEGQIGSVDVDILTSILLNFNTLIKEINKELKGYEKFSLQINTFQKGSYDIFCSLSDNNSFLAPLFSLISGANLQYASTIIATIRDLFELKEFLNGKKPISIDKTDECGNVNIRNYQNECKLFNKSVLNLALSNLTINNTTNYMFQTAEQIPQIEAFTMKDNTNKPTFRIERKNFNKMYNTDILLAEEDNLKIIEGEEKIIEGELTKIDLKNLKCKIKLKTDTQSRAKEHDCILPLGVSFNIISGQDIFVIATVIPFYLEDSLGVREIKEFKIEALQFKGREL